MVKVLSISTLINMLALSSLYASETQPEVEETTPKIQSNQTYGPLPFEINIQIFELVQTKKNLFACLSKKYNEKFQDEIAGYKKFCDAVSSFTALTYPSLNFKVVKNLTTLLFSRPPIDVGGYLDANKAVRSYLTHFTKELQYSGYDQIKVDNLPTTYNLKTMIEIWNDSVKTKFLYQDIIKAITPAYEIIKATAVEVDQAKFKDIVSSLNKRSELNHALDLLVKYKGLPSDLATTQNLKNQFTRFVSKYIKLHKLCLDLSGTYSDFYNAYPSLLIMEWYQKIPVDLSKNKLEDRQQIIEELHTITTTMTDRYF